MTLILIILIIIFIIVFIITMIKIRNKAFKLKENIKEHKSALRLVKSKYLSVLELSDSVHSSNAQKGNRNYSPSSLISIGRGAEAYAEGNRVIENLANEYLNAQNQLNYSIKIYNEYILKFPRVIFTRLLGYKREKYIEDDKKDYHIGTNPGVDKIDF